MIPTIEIHAEWFRCVSLRRDPLSGEGARLLGGRLNPPGMPALYLAGTPTLAVAENLRLGSLYGVARFPPRLLVTVEVTLARVIDLRSEHVLTPLGMTRDELIGEWCSDIEPTRSQLLGLRLASLGLEGAHYPSFVESGTDNLVVFTRNVDAEHSVRVVNRS